MKTEQLELSDEHSWDEGVVTTAPTCTEAGVKMFTCTVCKKTRTEAVKETGHQHKEVRNKKDATCTAKGYTGDTWCTDCNTVVETGKETPALGHDFKETGRTEATCKDTGLVTYKCSRCGETKTDVLEKTDKHTWNDGKIIVAPKCETAGTIRYTCTVCSVTKDETVEATGHQHTVVRNQSAATCTTNGYTGDTYCTDCGAKLSSGAWVNAVGHSYGAPYVTAWPSAVAEGRMAHSCTRCGYTDTWATARIAATGNFNATNVPLKVKKSFTLKVENMAVGDWVASWRSSNTKVATVNGAGKVTARKKTGKTTITAVLASGRVISTTVKVQKGNVNTSRVVLNSPNFLTLKVKQGAQVSAVRYPVTSQQGIRYSTSNKKVATVNKKGRITAKKVGKAKIYVKSGKKKATVNVRVIK